jgi:hypothetical protein
MISLDAPLSEELFEIAVDRPNRRYQRTANRTTSGGNRNPANADGSVWIGG